MVCSDFNESIIAAANGMTINSLLKELVVEVSETGFLEALLMKSKS